MSMIRRLQQDTQLIVVYHNLWLSYQVLGEWINVNSLKVRLVVGRKGVGGGGGLR